MRKHEAKSSSEQAELKIVARVEAKAGPKTQTVTVFGAGTGLGIVS